jgi:hypothetical protein
LNSHGIRIIRGKRGLEKLEGKEFLVVYSSVIFLGKGKRRMESIGKWWKGGKWVEFLGCFKE